MSVKAILIRKSTQEILKRGNLPVSDPTQSVPNLDPDLEWLIVYDEFGQPEYDPRLFLLEKTEAITSTPHPTYSNYNQFSVSWATVKRDAEYIKQRIDDRERTELEKEVDYTERDKLILLGLTVLFRNLDGVQLNNKERAIKQRVIAAGVNLWKNDARVQALKAAVDADDDIDMDSGWAR